MVYNFLIGFGFIFIGLFFCRETFGNFYRTGFLSSPETEMKIRKKVTCFWFYLCPGGVFIARQSVAVCLLDSYGETQATNTFWKLKNPFLPPLAVFKTIMGMQLPLNEITQFNVWVQNITNCTKRSYGTNCCIANYSLPTSCSYGTENPVSEKFIVHLNVLLNHRSSTKEPFG